MTIKETVEEKLEKLGRAIGSDDSLIENLMSRIDVESVDKSDRAGRSNNKLITGRFTMNYFVKIAVAAAIILAVALSIVVIDKLTSQAYAFEETLDAVKYVQFIHIVSRDKAGQAKDERWIEIGPDGFQVRYRQDNPPNFFVVEDGETVSVYYKDKNTIVLYDPKDRQYQWIGNLGEWLKELAGQGGIVIEENVDYWGLLKEGAAELGATFDMPINPAWKGKLGGTYDLVLKRLDQMKNPQVVFDPFTGPIFSRKGKIAVPGGERADYVHLLSIEYAIKGVVGPWPGEPK